MAWPKGKQRPETAGRRKGTPNKKTQAIMDVVNASGKDPLKTLLDLLDHDDVSIRLASAKELCQYLYPKRKAVELTGDMNASVTFEKLDGTAERYSIGPKGDDDDN